MNRNITSRLGRVTIAATITLIFSILNSTVAAAQAVKQDYPRLGGMQIGKSLYEGNVQNADYRKELAKYDYVVLGNPSKQLSAWAEDIKSHNPKIILAKYQNIAETRLNVNDYDTKLRAKLDSESGPNRTNAFDWWLRDKDGKRIEMWPNTYRTNLTEYVKADQNGDRWPGWRAKQEYERFFKYSVWDAWYVDLTNWKPKFANQGLIGDYSGGKVSNSDEIYAAYRRAHRSYWAAARKLTPDKHIVVNHNWYRHHDSNGNLDLAEYKGANGGYLEYIMDIEVPRPWHDSYLWYRRTMTYFDEPNLILFDARGREGDYKYFRYTFATCLLGNGFFDYSPNTQYQKGSVLWFDEFDLAGASDSRWMGRPISATPKQAWKKGVYRRDFENAVVLINPEGNGNQSFSIESGLFRIDGKQDRSVNNGKAVSSLTLPEGDGIILVRGQSVTQNAPPTAPDLTVD